MTLETWIGLRYLRAKKRSGFVSFISIISILGIAIGVAVLILVMSVVNGFQKDIRAQLLNIAPHAEMGYMMPEEGKTWRDLRKIIDGKPEVLATAPFVAGQALLANSGEVRGVQVRGVLPENEKQVVDYANKMVVGKFENLREDEFDIILGAALANDLGAEVGGQVTVITPEGNVTPAGVVPRLKQFNVVGIVKTGVDEADRAMALTHLTDAQKLYRISEAETPLRLRLRDPQNAPEIMANLLPESLQQDIWTHNWTDNNRSYFNAVEMEKRLLTLLLACIILVAVFNLVSSLVMVVKEKQADIAILRTLGLSPAGVMKIFVVQGMVAGTLGTLAGTIVGLIAAAKIGAVVAWIEEVAGRQLVASQVYFINHLPSDIQAADVIGTVCISLTLSFLATLYPSWSASRTQPAEALRYE
ncbi:MAG: lipoprotein-releasing ABC transporter permease subunit [Alysiella sp.]|uniref:lipoprotein-releasing ABC transporter permease subunit n=1 Tax=Alysiella sp. TaxID=1872483 RepID=UPI0026DD1AFD|nr:lipoprotein-releasing ABC transporter permease subunit [Alysiella sp.]MDO4432984.1 lipoprotein-releasing ABC transporter permease subunit [Alysiella sp.]